MTSYMAVIDSSKYRAGWFLDRLEQLALPSLEIQRLVWAMRAEPESEEWYVREYLDREIKHMDKVEPRNRQNLTRRTSLLRREVHPDEVVLELKPAS